MPQRTRQLIASVILSAGYALIWASHYPSRSWIRFAVFLVAILMSSGLKVILPKGEGSMSLNFPFILLALIQLSPMQAILLAALSVAAQCRLRVKKLFTLIQIVFNIANSVTATAIACGVNLLLTKHGMASAPAVALASVTYFFASTVPVAVAIASSKGQKSFPVWKTEFPWYLPFYFVGAILASTADGIGVRFGSGTSLLIIPLVYTMYRAYTAQIVQAKERQKHLDETEALHLRTIEGLAMAIEAKDQETHEHLFRVRSYVTEVGNVLQLPELEMKALHTAAFLHDIGKLAVPEHIINKPGKLTLEEFEKMKIHPVVGADILDRVRFPYPVVPIVRSHHEWWNGQGYPDGLKREEIPVGARILTVVDCFDALTSDRPYRKGKSLEDAMAIVQSLSGTQFDPAIVDVFRHHCLTLEKQARYDDGREFIPLNREIEVWRGAAPGAGFEEQNGTPDHIPEVSDDIHSSELGSENNSSAQVVAAANQEANALFEISRSLGSSLHLQEMMALITSRLHNLVPFHCGALYVKEGDTVVLRHVDGEDQRCFSIQPIAMGEGISGWVAQSGKAILNGNAAVEPSYHPKQGQQETLRATLSIPLYDPEREVFGALTLYSFNSDSFSKDHLRTLQVMQSKLSLSLHRLLHRSHPGVESDTDDLTKLPNARQLFLQLDKELIRCGRTATSLAMIMCDLNSFKEVNDREGQRMGDKLLSAIATRFREGCRNYDTVARVGGDQFIFLLPDTSNVDLADRLSSIATMVAAARHSSGVLAEISSSLGTCSFPADGNTAEDLLALVERRMYQQKQAHRRQREKASMATTA